MLPGKASGVPSPSRFLTRLETNAAPRPQKGPRKTAQRTFTRCCTGAHLEPSMGKENVEPTTARAARRAAVTIRLVCDVCIEASFPDTGCVSKHDSG